MLPKGPCTLLKVKFRAFYDFWAYFLFLLPVFHKNGCFTLKMDTDVFGNFFSFLKKEDIKKCSNEINNKYLLEYIGYMFRPVNRSSSGL